MRRKTLSKILDGSSVCNTIGPMSNRVAKRVSSQLIAETSGDFIGIAGAAT